METFFISPNTSLVPFGSYRTYEEWKLNISIYIFYELGGSYRTYEEWKRT